MVVHISFIEKVTHLRKDSKELGSWPHRYLDKENIGAKRRDNAKALRRVDDWHFQGRKKMELCFKQ